jgi:hypothetical protein
MVGVTLQLPRLDRALVLLLTVVGLGAAAFTWARVVQTISDARPPAATMRATSIVWNDRVFQSPAGLARWLRSRGATYAGWSSQHPAGRDLLERRPAKPDAQLHPTAERSSAAGRTPAAAPATRPHRSAAPTNGPDHASAPPTATTGTPTRSPVNEAPSTPGFPLGRIFVALLALLAAACAGTATLPRAVLGRFPNLARTVAPYRALLLGGAAALMIGIVAGAALN